MTSEATINAFSEGIAVAIPESSLTVSQWAAAYRFLSPERSARPGRWRNELVPYLVEVMDTVGKPGVREIVFVKSAQVAGTECANNIMGYFMHVDPSPILYVCETEPKAKAWSQESLAPMIRDTPVLKAIVSDARSRDSGNTIDGKSFPGGHLAIGHATSAATLSSRPRRIVVLDERDAYKATAEGDPAKLAEARTKTFDDAIIFKPSTPRDRMEPRPGTPPDEPRYSPIELEYENSDKRRYHVPCPHCGEYQPLVWKRGGDFTIRWDGDDVESAYYVCVNGCVIEHEHKTEMLAAGRWVPEKPFRGRAGFIIWEGYSPFVTWGAMARNFLEAKKSKEALRVFVNTSLAEGWEDLTELASVEDLTKRGGEFGPDDVPDGVLVVTAAADVQGDRLEYEITGWGLDFESWSLEYGVIEGDPARRMMWNDLKGRWTTPLRRGDGTELRIAAACVDSGGHHTDEVYRFCYENGGRKWRAVKGANTPGKPLVSKPTMQGEPGRQVRLYTVGTEAAKDTFAAHLAVAEPGPGYCHFPEGRDEGYFKQLRSERPTVRAGVRRWEKLRESSRNEALDLRVYNMAALAILNPSWRVLQRRRLEASAPPAEQPADDVDAPGEDEEDAPEPPSTVRRPARRGQRGFVNNWR